MRVVLVLLMLLTLNACATKRMHPELTAEEDILFKRLIHLMAGMSYDMACNGRTLDSYKDMKNPDNLRLSKNRKVMISRLHYLWQQRHPELSAKEGLQGIYLMAAGMADVMDKEIRAKGCDSSIAQEAKKELFLFSKSEPEAVNMKTNEYIAKEGGYITAIK